jgi:hypothetical protein
MDIYLHRPISAGTLRHGYDNRNPQKRQAKRMHKSILIIAGSEFESSDLQIGPSLG